VVIPTYNRAGLIRDALEGLKKQTYKDIEVIIIDDCSTDDTGDVVKRWREENKDVFSDFIYLKLPRNRDEWWAWNIGFYLAKGEYIAIHSSDDISHERRIEREVEYLTGNIDTAVVGTSYKVFIYNLNLIVGVADWLVFDTNEIEMKYKQHFEHSVCTGTVLFKADVLDTIIGFRKVTNSLNDYYFIDDLINHDYIVANIKEDLYYIRQHEGQKSKQLEQDSRIVDTKYVPEALRIEKDRVSAVIVLENASDSIINTLESISEQTYKNIELVIVDNEFNENIENRITKWWEDKKGKEETAIRELIYFKPPRKVHYPWTYNLGAYLAKGEYIAFHGENGTSDKYRMEKQVEYLKGSFLTSIVGTNYVSRYEYNDEDNIEIDEDIEYCYIVDYIPCININTVMLRSEVINETGGFNRKIMGREAFEFIYRLLSRGYRVQNLREVLYDE
ncbi:MAG: glycosyltransferase, partial [Bacillota bacterium]|nr:glycosyltransferase [Bacillota bacterium]